MYVPKTIPPAEFLEPVGDAVTIGIVIRVDHQGVGHIAVDVVGVGVTVPHRDRAALVLKQQGLIGDHRQVTDRGLVPGMTDDHAAGGAVAVAVVLPCGYRTGAPEAGDYIHVVVVETDTLDHVVARRERRPVVERLVAWVLELGSGEVDHPFLAHQIQRRDDIIKIHVDEGAIPEDQLVSLGVEEQPLPDIGVEDRNGGGDGEGRRDGMGNRIDGRRHRLVGADRRVEDHDRDVGRGVRQRRVVRQGHQRRSHGLVQLWIGELQIGDGADARRRAGVERRIEVVDHERAGQIAGPGHGDRHAERGVFCDRGVDL